jgi:hypothetical protein
MAAPLYAVHYEDPSTPRVSRIYGSVVAFLKASPPNGHVHEVRTEECLKHVPKKALVALYNAAAAGELAGEDTFKDKATAARHVFPMLEALTKQAPAERPAAPEPPEPKIPRKPGVCAFIAERLKAGDDTDAVLARVKAQFPDSRAGRSDVSIVRGKIKKGSM